MTVTLATEFSETGQTEPWKNLLAKELNVLLLYARTHRGLAPVAVSLAQRTADFEEITVLKGEE